MDDEQGRRGSLHVCFGEHQTTLLDEFERLTLEIQLNRAMLRRSLSEPIAPPRAKAQPPEPESPPPLPPERPRPSRLRRALRWLLRPVLGGRRCRGAVVGAGPSDPRAWKAFSRSHRVWKT